MCIEKDGVRIETVNGDANCLGVKILPVWEMGTGASGKYDVGNKSDSFGQQLQPILHKAATWNHGSSLAMTKSFPFSFYSSLFFFPS